MNGKQKERQKRHSRLRSKRMSCARAKASHTFQEWEALRSKANGVCPRCLRETRRLQKDHITPIYMGGSDGVDNLQPLCMLCNNRKKDESIDWMKVRGLRDGD